MRSPRMSRAKWLKGWLISGARWGGFPMGGADAGFKKSGFW